MNRIRITATIELPELEASVQAGRITAADADATLRAAQRDLEDAISLGNARFEYAFKLHRPWNRM